MTVEVVLEREKDRRGVGLSVAAGANALPTWHGNCFNELLLTVGSGNRTFPLDIFPRTFRGVYPP